MLLPRDGNYCSRRSNSTGPRTARQDAATQRVPRELLQPSSFGNGAGRCSKRWTSRAPCRFRHPVHSNAFDSWRTRRRHKDLAKLVPSKRCSLFGAVLSPHMEGCSLRRNSQHKARRGILLGSRRSMRLKAVGRECPAESLEPAGSTQSSADKLSHFSGPVVIRKKL